MLALKPITLLPARERVAASLRKAIISRQIAQGEILTLESTAQALGVSVTPVREAFQVLSRDGLIALKQNKTAVVLGISRKTIIDHYQLRAGLESFACRLLCENGADLEPIAHAVTSARRALDEEDSDSYSGYNQAFHYEIWTAAGNLRMKAMLAELWNGLSMGVKTTQAEYALNSQREHEEIFEALQRRDGEAASRRMFHHIQRSMEDILTHYPE